MLLTKECDYALRIIRNLSDGEMKTVQSICDIEFVPHKYAYKILKKLQKAEFVQNKRGPEGGYIINKPLDTFTMYDVINAIDERLFLSECLRTDANCPLQSESKPCKFHQELLRIQTLLVNEIKSKNIYEILFL